MIVYTAAGRSDLTLADVLARLPEDAHAAWNVLAAEVDLSQAEVYVYHRASLIVDGCTYALLGDRWRPVGHGRQRFEYVDGRVRHVAVASDLGLPPFWRLHDPPPPAETHWIGDVRIAEWRIRIRTFARMDRVYRDVDGRFVTLAPIYKEIP